MPRTALHALALTLGLLTAAACLVVSALADPAGPGGPRPHGCLIPGCVAGGQRLPGVDGP